MKYKIGNYNLEDIYKIKDSGMLFSILVSIMRKLRSPDGCIWDREQNHSTIKKNLIEEAYEVTESIENNDLDGLKEELGDLLLQIVFHSQVASENGNFDINEVLKIIIKKLIRRHPHVFGEKSLKNSEEVLASWEDIKKKERKEKYKESDSIFSELPKILPSLHYAHEIQNRASRLGFDWDNLEGVFRKINEEISEMNREVGSLRYIKKKSIPQSKMDRIQDEIGDILFSIVNFSRHLGIDCEESLKNTCKKFIRRFDFMEKYAEKKNIDFKKLTLEEKDRLWEISKKKGL